jgi:lipopolysaccharide biosynthesis protein
MELIRKFVSLGYWLIDSEKSWSDFTKKPTWKNLESIYEEPTRNQLGPLVLTAHVYYPKFALELIELLKELPKETKLLATTPSTLIKNRLESFLGSSGNLHDIRLTPNTGRNFGPLLVEFSKILLNEKSFVHVHSKRSQHSPSIAKEWVQRNSSLLLTATGLQRTSALATSNSRIGLIHVDVSDLLWGINWRWGRSLGSAKKEFEGLPGFRAVKWRGKLSFPAGGMFWVRTESISPLLSLDWKYEQFPRELGQGDGEIQHAIERLIGELPTSLGFDQAIFSVSEDKFYKVEGRKIS